MKKKKVAPRTAARRPAAKAQRTSPKKRTATRTAQSRSVSAPKTTARASATARAATPVSIAAPSVARTPAEVPQRRELYPAIEPYSTGYLRVSEIHELYYEESGNPAGKPAIFLHGGPGAGSDRRARQFFDPQHYRIVVFDQRGCGRSRPSASLV